MPIDQQPGGTPLVPDEPATLGDTRATAPPDRGSGPFGTYPASGPDRTPALVPPVASAVWTDERLLLTADTTVVAPPRIAELLRQVLAVPTGLPLATGSSTGPTLTFELRDDPSLGTEGYALRVGEQGVHAVAAREDGLRWAVQTIRQLLPVELYRGRPVPGVRWELPGVEIVDAPRLPWRGALLDVARWHRPVELLFEFVDLLALHKLNTLHLHLTDDQGWRFESREYPRLTEVGAWRSESSAGHLSEGRFDGSPHGGFYTQEQLRDLVAYAALRGVRIMPEIDMPGHVQAALCAYPRLGNQPDRQWPVYTAWGVSKHILNTDDDTLAFMRTVLDELVDVFPFEYVHLGGDEVPLDEWSASPAALDRVRREGLTGVSELLGWWIGQMSRHLATHGRKAAAWDEVLDARPPRDLLVFAWRSAERVRGSLALGHPVVAVPQEYLYLDRFETEDPAEPLAIGGPLPLSRVYGYEPVRPNGSGQVLGVQGMLWSEYVPRRDLLYWRAFPRLTAIAASSWSTERDEAAFRATLPTHLRRLDQMGVGYRPPAGSAKAPRPRRSPYPDRPGSPPPG